MTNTAQKISRPLALRVLRAGQGMIITYRGRIYRTSDLWQAAKAKVTP